MWAGLSDLFLRSSAVSLPTACSDETHCHVCELAPGEAQLSRAEGGPWPTAFEELSPSNGQVSELGSGSFPS